VHLRRAIQEEIHEQRLDLVKGLSILIKRLIVMRPNVLAIIEPEKPGFDLGTFECQRCQHVETVVVKFG